MSHFEIYSEFTFYAESCTFLHLFIQTKENEHKIHLKFLFFVMGGKSQYHAAHANFMLMLLLAH